MKKNVLKILDKETLIKNILIIPKIPWKQGQGLKINEKTKTCGEIKKKFMFGQIVISGSVDNFSALPPYKKFQRIKQKINELKTKTKLNKKKKQQIMKTTHKNNAKNNK